MKEKTSTGKSATKRKGMLRLVKPGEVPRPYQGGEKTRAAKSTAANSAWTEEALEKSIQHAGCIAPGDKLAYNVREAAEAIGVSPWYVRDEMSLGRLGYSSARGRKIIPRWELVRYLEEYILNSRAIIPMPA
ncbi:MAG: hypothetical protein AB9917_20125 [Negativicutes bacterium]